MKQHLAPGLLIFLLLLTTIGIEKDANGSGQPDWISGISSRYPKERFLAGIGSAESRKDAEATAYAAISRIFIAEINQRTQEREKYFQTDTKDKSTWYRDIEIEQLTTVSTRKVLENVYIAETYLDKENQTYYALAVMDRLKAASVFRQRITTLDLEHEELLKLARVTNNKLQKVRLLHKAIKKMHLRDAYNTDLRVVSLTGSGYESLSQISGLQQKLQDFLSRNFRITIIVTGKNSDLIKKAVIEGLNRHGLPVSLKNVATPDIEIKGSVDFQPIEMQHAEFIRWNLSFVLRDPSTNKIIGSINRHGREGHLTKSQARIRALHAAQRKLSSEISKHLADYIFGEKPD